MRGQRLDFGGEDHAFAGAGPKQRANPKRIADQCNAPAVEVNDGDRELTIQARRHGEAFALVELEQDLDFRVGGERFALVGEFAPQVAVIEDLAVKTSATERSGVSAGCSPPTRSTIANRTMPMP